ncbi:MAG: D-sedoheptulose 7-phosphate isomerase [Cyclobacteriaceae bacterium]|jgi:D-sedoheptulose 7-phosphate isomerase|nr:D-sedoheptulose 7-phosphate isomerase [Cyclobacteriaceae bacterium]
MDNISLIKSELNQAKAILDEFINNPYLIHSIADAATIICEKLSAGGKILSCGNGGSHCDAMHFAEELTGRYRNNRKPIPAIAISDPSYISCVGNDYGFDQIFSRYVEALGSQHDVLVCISTSGNSENIINAATVARNKKMVVLSLTGNTGGKLAELSDLEIRVPHSGYADRIQEMHIKIIHLLILLIEKNIH